MQKSALGAFELATVTKVGATLLFGELDLGSDSDSDEEEETQTKKSEAGFDAIMGWGLPMTALSARPAANARGTQFEVEKDPTWLVS